MNILTFESKEIEFDILNITDYRARHLLEVLKAKPGQILRVGEIGGLAGEARVEEINQKGVKLKILQLRDVTKILELEIILALPRPQTLKKVLELIGCLSVKKITLVKTSKVENSYFQSSILKDIKKYLILGMQQGCKTYMPEVLISTDFYSTFSAVQSLPKIVAHNKNSKPMSAINFDKNSLPTIAFGPEGGWSENELDFFSENNFVFMNLSSSVLRVENAICAALSQYELLRNYER